MKSFNIEERVGQALENFESGYNCSQSVFLAYADVIDIDLELAGKMTVSFGGGIGRLREVCGTISALAMLAGFRYPPKDDKDIDSREQNALIVQRMAGQFKQNHGSLICRDLLTFKGGKAQPTRLAMTKTKKPCGMYVEEAARIAGRMLKGEFE